MHRTRLLTATVTGSIVALLLGASLQSSATASNARPDPLKGGAVEQARPAADQSRPGKNAGIRPFAAYKNYQVVFSALLADNAGVQTFGAVACPTGRTAIGGGAIISSSSLSENLNGSFPSGSSWGAYVNNSSGTNGTFRVYAVCVKKVAKYQVVTTSVPNQAGVQNSATVTCPSGTVVLSGGGVGSSSSTLQNLNSSLAQGNGWRVDNNNASGSDASVTVYAVCGKKPSGYAAVTGTAVTNASGAQTSAFAGCPSGTVPIGGGALSGSGSTSTNLNSTAPSGSGWVSYENNGAGFSTSLTPSVLCAQAS